MIYNLKHEMNRVNTDKLEINKYLILKNFYSYLKLNKLLKSANQFLTNKIFSKTSLIPSSTFSSLTHLSLTHFCPKLTLQQVVPQHIYYGSDFVQI